MKWSGIIALTALILLPTVAYASAIREQAYTERDAIFFAYTHSGENDCAISMGKADFAIIRIPAKCPEGHNVTAITDKGFNVEKFPAAVNITSVTIPDSVTSIGWGAFWGCASLTSITIPDSVASIHFGAFAGCISLAIISVGTNNSNFSSEGGMFYSKDKTSLLAYPMATGEITIPDRVTSIGDAAFIDCTGLTSVIIHNSVTSIGEGAFFGCTGLTSIIIPNSVTSIGDKAFSRCTGLTSVTIPNSVTSIDAGVFGGCVSLTSVVIPDSVTSIGDAAFFRCTNLTSITIPDSVINIDVSAFSGCTGLTSITIPDSVINIDGTAFFACTNLTSITIPSSVISIGYFAFLYCDNLTSVTFQGTNTTLTTDFPSFPGDLCYKYLAGGIGTYTRTSGSNAWTKQQ